MYYLFPTILLILPSFGFASPVQPVNSLDLTATDPLTANPIRPEKIDSRFTMQPLYQAVSLVEDDCLLSAIQLLGLWSSKPSASREGDIGYWDDHYPHVLIQARGPTTGSKTELRFLVWGLYLGLKDMIQSNRFKSVQFALRWEGQVVGMISIQARSVRLSLPGENSTDSTNMLRKRSSSNPSNLLPGENLSGTSFNLSVATTPSNPFLELNVVVIPLEDKPLPKFNFIMAILDGILTGASRQTQAQVSELVQVSVPPPFGASMLLMPRPTTSGQPFLTFGLLGMALRQIPAGLLQREYGWVEVKMEILVNDFAVARGALANL